MAEHNVPSQGTVESITSATAQSQYSDVPLGSQVSACKRLVDKAIERGLSALELAESLKDLGLKAGEAIDYIDEFD